MSATLSDSFNWARVAGLHQLAGVELTPHRILMLAATSEQPSEHPLGRAIVAAEREAALDLAEPE